MNVRDLTIVLRPRSSWEAVDLGTGLAKRYYRDLFRMGFVGFGPFFVLLAMLCWKLPLLLPLLIWWLKPLFDRFYLFYLSRRIFGQEVTVRETWKEWKRLLFQGAFSLLTWRRFLPSRSMTMAVSDLENLTGSMRGVRCGVVARVGGGAAFMMTLGGLFLELVGLSTVSVLAGVLIPQGQGPGWDSMVVWFGQGGVGQTLLTLFFGLSYGMLVLLLEPIYLAGGFALYLNSRTSQEGWDIELRFRELAARVSKTKLSVLAVAGLSLFFTSPRGFAEGYEAQEVIAEVLAHEDFTNHVEEYKEWVPEEGGWMERLADWLEQWEGGSSVSTDASGAGAVANGLFRIVGILALGLLVVALVVLMVNLFRGRSVKEGPREKGFKRPPPKVVMGMDVTPESLPNDILAQARHYWSEGQVRLAMSLLYRGALTKLITEQEVVIESSDTELECLAQVESAAPGNLAGYFKILSVQWMKAAYSKEEVPADAFERLCATWPFGRRSE